MIVRSVARPTEVMLMALPEVNADITDEPPPRVRAAVVMVSVVAAVTVPLELIVTEGEVICIAPAVDCISPEESTLTLLKPPVVVMLMSPIVLKLAMLMVPLLACNVRLPDPEPLNPPVICVWLRLTAPGKVPEVSMPVALESVPVPVTERLEAPVNSMLELVAVMVPALVSDKLPAAVCNCKALVAKLDAVIELVASIAMLDAIMVASGEVIAVPASATDASELLPAALIRIWVPAPEEAMVPPTNWTAPAVLVFDTVMPATACMDAICSAALVSLTCTEAAAPEPAAVPVIMPLILFWTTDSEPLAACRKIPSGAFIFPTPAIARRLSELIVMLPTV